MLRIGPVRPAERRRALRLLVGGRGAGARKQEGQFEALLAGPQANSCKLWWARVLRGPRAAAMTVRSPGRTAMILCGRADSCPTDTLGRLLTELTDAALADDLSLVQAIFAAGAGDTQAFLQAGYRHLAELVYLRRGLSDLPEVPATALKWEWFRAGEEDLLGRVIDETYVDSQDCPGLRGLRRMQDIIAGHKASGIFRPESWWMPTHQGAPVGCALINDVADRADAAEVVYMGVRPAHRRRGFGRAMLRHALLDASQRGMKAMRLAADAANTPAAQLYRKEGFREVVRKDVFIRSAGSPPNA
jgi:ribosomal protein S18 acetylase RimI-like enzyme